VCDLWENLTEKLRVNNKLKTSEHSAVHYPSANIYLMIKLITIPHHSIKKLSLGGGGGQGGTENLILKLSYEKELVDLMKHSPC
jgi:hypothetical protein